ncbi:MULTISPECIES: FAD-dependent monooxygenase [unclassified Streptomyces]|uniref:FAD-dependent monooxygenase n=1 Tax=unclassified Streptomyces TaxID=2593676 RepID=UPI000BF0E91B|nr:MULTISPECIES: FAD-dependent monooxygenase [unclassified Streptomyces]MBK3547644.1 FAD-dependent monooxygenase [Streptomyces sp. MBT60]
MGVTDVLIVGAGPTGLVLACDLARRGAAVRIVDRSPVPPRTSRAKGPNARSLEILDDLGVAEEVLAAGSAPLPMLKYRDRLPVAETDPWADSAPSPDAPYDRGRLIAQWRLEEILRDRLAGYGVRVELGREVTGLAEGPGGRHVDVAFAEGRTERARYVVGCDGAHSSVRKLLGIGFEGTTAEDQVMVCGDVDLADGALDRTRWHQWFDEDGAVMLCPIPGTRTGWWFQAGPERDGRGRPLAPTADGFRRLLARHTALPGRALTRAELLSTYRVNVRMADRFRAGRVLLAGDAAHVHAVAGGLGMNTGIQDAFNLGWKLGLVLAGHAGPELLDTYEEERLPVAARTLDLTSERLRATLEAIRRPGGGLDAAITPDTTGLGVGYRWSSLARGHAEARQAGDGSPEAPDAEAPKAGDGSTTTPDAEARTARDGERPAPRPGDRAPDAPCVDAATGARTRLHRVFAGPRTTVLGFGPGSAAVLREVAAGYGDAGVRTCRVYAAHEDRATSAPGEAVVDEEGHATAAYGRGASDGTGTGTSTVVVVRPDHHLGLSAPAADARSVHAYLHRLHGAARSAERFSGIGGRRR